MVGRFSNWLQLDVCFIQIWYNELAASGWLKPSCMQLAEVALFVTCKVRLLTYSWLAICQARNEIDRQPQTNELLIISLSISDTIIVYHIGKKGLYLSINKNGIFKYIINQEIAFLCIYSVFPTWMGKIEINAISIAVSAMFFSFLLPLAVLLVQCVVLETEDTKKHILMFSFQLK